MDCREFGKNHLAFVDDTLSAVDTAAMRRHLQVCSRCARLDTRIRRGLLLARNLPVIQPSADFMERLNLRLREVGPIDRFAAAASPSYRDFSVGMFSAIAAGVMAVTLLASALLGGGASDEALRLPPVVASVPEPEPQPAPVASPVYVASFMSGMPVWPAVMHAGEASLHMANVELRQASLERE
ncbi:MAG TPA: zf-HC2 domain-containing protein [Vicinamibacterales bacterium]|nr:zf-HC2 domain-containing protein [Vicinamibacterales bacterium]